MRARLSRRDEGSEKVPQLAGHLHLLVQHGSDHILTAMKRVYTVLGKRSIARWLRAVRLDLLRSIHFIMGFPAETGEDFLKTDDIRIFPN